MNSQRLIQRKRITQTNRAHRIKKKKMKKKKRHKRQLTPVE